MKQKTLTNLLSIISISYLMIACVGEVGYNNKTPMTGKVVDDYIAGAIVCADVNHNDIPDDGVENCVETDAQGNFKFPRQRMESLVMQGGVDIGTGKPFKGTFFAPPGSSVVNPLTTLIHSVQSEGGKTLEEAQKIVKDKLGLSNTNVDLTKFDPLAELQFGEATKTKEVAQQVLAQQTNIQVILTVTATTIVAASSDTVEENEVAVEAVNQVAQLMLTEANSDTAPAINSEESIQTIIEESAKETFSANTEEHTQALEAVVAVQTVVAQQIQETTETVIQNIETVQVTTTEESGLTAIKASNSAILLVTDTQEDSITNTIQEAVTTGDTTTLATVDITTAIDNSKNELIERPPVIEIVEDEIKVRPTGGEGGTP